MLAGDLALIEKSLHVLGCATKRGSGQLVVMLPLLCSVVLQTDGNSIRITPKFGFVQRSTATWLMFCVVVVTPLFFFFSLGASFAFKTPFLVWIVYMITILMIWDVFRYVLTENMITRVQFLLMAGHAEDQAAPADGSPTAADR